MAPRTITIEELNAKLISIHAEMQGIQSAADAETRDLTPEEVEKFTTLKAAFDATEKEIARRKELQAMAARLDAPEDRMTMPPEVEIEGEVYNRAQIPGQPRRIVRATPGLEGAREKGRGGFRNFGDFALRVRAASLRPTAEDSRLKLLNAAATTAGQESVGGDGGYLVPPEFRTELLEKVMGEDSLLSMTDQIATESNAVTFPVDEDEPWSNSGIQVYWAAEGQAAAQSKPAVRPTTIHANKLIALVPMGDELINDAGVADSYLRKKAPEKILYKVNDAIINGDGAGKPIGILKSASLETVAAEGGQTADTVNYTNISKMWARMYAPCRRRGVWLINQDLETQLDVLVVPGTTAAFPAYLPPGGLSNSPFGSLKGRPVMYSEACGALGDVGDIIFVDLSQYMTLIKNGGIRTDVSIHLFFDADQSAYRFILRIGGQPWWAKSITRAKSANKLSSHIALAAR